MNISWSCPPAVFPFLFNLRLLLGIVLVNWSRLTLKVGPKSSISPQLINCIPGMQCWETLSALFLLWNVNPSCESINNSLKNNSFSRDYEFTQSRTDKKRVVTNISSKQRRSIFNSLQHICFSMLWCYCISYYNLNSEQRKKAFIPSVSVHSRTLTINSDQVKEQRIGCGMQVPVTRLMKGHTYCFKEKTETKGELCLFLLV